MSVWPEARLAPPRNEALDPRQREVTAAIAAGPRGEVRGPLGVWLHRPDLADRVQTLGRYCRYETSLEPRLSELAICTVASVWRAEFEWHAHAPLARAAGIGDAILDSIRVGARPTFAHEDEEIVHAVALTAHRDRQIPDELYEGAERVLGRDRLVDLVGILGYYALISLTINVFRIPPATGTPAAFGGDGR